MKVEELINELQNKINDGKSVPFGNGKVIVNSDELFDIIDEIIETLPSELRQAKNVVADRNQILSQANREAESVIRAAEERKKVMLNQNEIVREAQAKGKEIIDDAKKRSEDIRKSANKYVISALEKTHQSMSTQLEGIKKTMSEFQKAQK